MPFPLPPNVGFPSPDGQTIYVSKSDWALLVARDLGIRQWMQAAADCLSGRP